MFPGSWLGAGGGARSSWPSPSVIIVSIVIKLWPKKSVKGRGGFPRLCAGRAEWRSYWLIRGEKNGKEKGVHLQVLAWPLRGSEPGNQTRSCGKGREFVSRPGTCRVPRAVDS